MKRFYITCFLYLAAGAVSCSKITDVCQAAGDEMLVVNPECVASTKAIAEEETLPDDYTIIMSAHLTDNDTPSNTRDYFTATEFTKNGDTWSAQPARYWPLSGKLDFLALATDTDSFDLSGRMDWDFNNCSKGVWIDVPECEGEPVELLYARCSQDKHEAVQMEFLHSQAYLSFEAKCDKPDILRITGIEIKDAYARGLLYISNLSSLRALWSFDDEDSKNVALWTEDKYYLTLSEEYQEFSKGIILPEQGQQTIVIHFMQRSSPESYWSTRAIEYTYDIAALGNMWRKGKKYIYKIDISLDPVTLTPKIVLDWGDEDIIKKDTL